MKENMKIRGQLRTYLQWPIILSVFLLAANLAVGIVSPAAGLVMSGFTVVYVLAALWLFMYRRKRLMGGLVEFSAEYAWVQKQLLYEMAVPYAIADTEGHFLWLNHSFSEIVGEDKNCRKNGGSLVWLPHFKQQPVSHGKTIAHHDTIAFVRISTNK